jgi:hypothetical protein
VGAVASPRHRVTRDPPQVGREAGNGEGKPCEASGTGRDMRAELAPGSRSDSKQDRDLAMVDPWGMLLEQLVELTAEDDDDGHGGKRGREIGA